MKETKQLFFKSLIDSAEFEYFNGGEILQKANSDHNKPVIVRPFDIFSQMLNGGKLEICFLNNRRKLILHDGDAFYGPAGLARHSTYLENVPRLTRFTLCSFSFFENLHLSNFFPDPFIIPASEGGSKIGQICLELKKNIDSTENQLSREISIKKLAMELLLIIVRNAKIDENSLKHIPLPGSACFNALNYLEKNYYKSITIHELAKIACLSTSRFHRVFKALTGLSPRAYIIDLRLRKAQEKLLVTDMPISAIAEAVGWSDAFYFSRIFHSKLNITPSQYRESRNLNT